MSSIKCRSWGWVVALAAAALIAGVAAPAQAKDEFEDAFKYELGRIAAHEAVYAGKHIVGTLLHVGHRHHGGHGYQGCSYGYGYHYRHHGHHRGSRYRHGSHRGDRHGYYRSRGRTVRHLSHHRSGGRSHRGRGH